MPPEHRIAVVEIRGHADYTLCFSSQSPDTLCILFQQIKQFGYVIFEGVRLMGRPKINRTMCVPGSTPSAVALRVLSERSKRGEL